MATLLLGVLIIVLFVQVGALRRRIEQLERERATRGMTATTADAVQATVTAARAELVTYIKDQYARGARRLEIEAALVEHGWAPGDVTAAFAEVTRFAGAVQPVAAAGVSSSADDVVDWLREDWLLKLGALLLLIALGWFTTYAFMNNWIGPAGRITLGLLVGVLVLLLGAWRIRSYVAQGGVFLVVGSTTILLTLFAARMMYEFFTPTMALLLMFLSTVFVATQSLMYRRPPLARAALLLAAAAPLLTASADPSLVGLFTYLFVVTLGTILVATLMSDRVLILLSIAVMSLYSLPIWSGTGGEERPALLLFALAFGALYFVVHAGSVLRGSAAARQSDLLTAAWSGLFLLCWIMTVAPSEWQSLLLSAWTVVYLAGSFLLFRATGEPRIVYVYAGTGVALLAAATAAELSGPALVIAYAIETAAVVILTHVVVRSSSAAAAVAWLFAIPLTLTMLYLEPGEWRSEAYRNALAVVATTAGVLVITSMYFFAQARASSDALLRKLAGVLAIVGSVVVYALLWRILMLLFPESLAVMLALVTYTIIGIGAYVSGLRGRERALQLYGGCLIGFVTLRLLFIDVWEMEMAGRIITFALIGMLLMATAFLGRPKSDKH